MILPKLQTRVERTTSEGCFIGIDNGVSGTIGIVYNNLSIPASIIKTPTFSCLDYTKSKKNITRIDTEKLKAHLEIVSYKSEIIQIAIERPMVNPGRFVATGSALRALEATLIVIEGMQIPYKFIDSKEWQKKMLPAGLEKAELKSASKGIALRLFPKLNELLKHLPDADGLLIAEYLRKTY